MPQLTEKIVITLSLLGAFPLFFLDREIVGFRRFAWLVAGCTGLTSHLFFYPTDEEGVLLDKITVAVVCVAVVPHIIKLMTDNMLIGLMSGPPMFIVIHLMVNTTVDAEEYWRLRCFVHVASFILPYLNHLPDAKPEVVINEASNEEAAARKDDAAPEENDESKSPSKQSKSSKTNKHKKK